MEIKYWLYFVTSIILGVNGFMQGFLMFQAMIKNDFTGVMTSFIYAIICLSLASLFISMVIEHEEQRRMDEYD